MKRSLLAACAAVLFAGLSGSVDAQPQTSAPPTPDARAPADEVASLSGPYKHDNLAIYIVHGRETAAGKRFLTLQEALEQKKFIVHETGNVNELVVENTGDVSVFIQAGDIVRGGKQDRMISIDIVIKPHSGRVRIEVYCVEHGRWQGRGSESTKTFSVSRNAVPSNAIKLAAKQGRDQAGVWAGVARSQERLSRSLSTGVASPQSDSSLQLTLENDAVRRGISDYIKALSDAVGRRPDAIGAVVMINGKAYCADVYGSNELFRKLWPKLLESAAVEAISARGDATAAAPASPNEARVFLAAAEKAKAEERALPDRMKIMIRETKDQVRFETVDTSERNFLLHLNCLQKEPTPVTPPAAQTTTRPGAQR